MSLLPTDTAAIRLTAAGWALFNILDFCYFRFTGRFGSWIGATTPPFIPFQVAFMWLWILLRAVSALAALRAVVFWRRHRLPGRLALSWLWGSIRATGVIKSLDNINVGNVWVSIFTPYANIGWAEIHRGVITLLVSLLMTAPVRRRLQRFFADFGRTARADASAAMAIAAMVGGDPLAAVRSAEERLRVIRMSQLCEEDMANNQDCACNGRSKILPPAPPRLHHGHLAREGSSVHQRVPHAIVEIDHRSHHHRRRHHHCRHRHRHRRRGRRL